MKYLFLFLFALALVGCGSSPEAANTAQAETELMADIIIRPAPNQSAVEITFYYPISEIVNGKESKGFGKKVIAVEDPKFNDTPLTPAMNLANQPIYKSDVSKAVAMNVISATVNGRRYEGSTMLETKMINRMTTIELEPR